MTEAVLAIDAGGTRSTAMVVALDGRVLAEVHGGALNYQTIGVDRARGTLSALVDNALQSAGTSVRDLKGAAYGIAGLDRPKDETNIRAFLPAVVGHIPHVLVNDAALVVRAGTSDGVGIAVISGTGVNTLGRNRKGAYDRIGGFAFELGDFGSGTDLGREALRRAMRGADGRAEPTVLYERLCKRLGVSQLEDIIDGWMKREFLDAGIFAPLVFEAAQDGDHVARKLLEEAGRDLARGALLLASRMFSPNEAVTFVLGGSVLQKGASDVMRRELAHVVKVGRPLSRVVILTVTPAVGAALLALDLVGSTSAQAFERHLGSRAEEMTA